MTVSLLAVLACTSGGADDTGADTAPPVDTGPSPYFEAVAALASPRLAYDGVGLTGYQGVDSAGAPFARDQSWIELALITRDFLSTGEDRYRCTWIGDVLEVGPVTLSDAAWIGWEVELAVDGEDDAPRTDCAGFEPARWGEGSPTTRLEARRWALGFSAGTLSFRADLEDAVVDGGLDWEADWVPYVFAGLVAFPDEDGAWVAEERAWCFGYTLDEEGALAYDGDGAPIRRPLGGADALPPGTLASCGYFGGVEIERVLGEE